MGDRYQPPPRGYGWPHEGAHRDQQPRSYHDQYDSYRGSGQHQGYCYGQRNGYDHYSGEGRNHRARTPPSPRPSGRYPTRSRQDPSRRAQSGGYTFRGAAGHDDTNRLPREEDRFSFRAPGPQAPRFPPAQAQSADPSRPLASRINGGPERSQRNKKFQGGAKRGPWRRPPPPHERDILRATRRSATPDQLEGMNAGGQTRFATYISSDDDDSSAGSENGKAPNKRLKTSKVDQTAVPKWSNPEYLTALPPPENIAGPKKDIVQVIRKSKLDAAPTVASQNAVTANADFISFDDLDDNTNEPDVRAEDDSMSDVSSPSSSEYEPPGPPSPPEPMRKKVSRERAQASSNNNAPRSLASRISSDDGNVGPPPPPPTDLIMPTDAELHAKSGRGNTRGQKRKHREQSIELGDIVPEWQSTGGNDTPWLTPGLDHDMEYASFRLELTSPSVDFPQAPWLTKWLPSLHKEICYFFDYVSPHRYEEAVRRDLIARVEKELRRIPNIPGARSVQILCFGSFASGLYLPTADMDLVAVTPDYLRRGIKTFCQHKKNLFNLAGRLKNSMAAVGTVSPVIGAKVPIVKFTDRLSGIKVDISFENDSGLQAIETFQDWKERHPAMPALVVLIKQFLAMRNLNEVFHGGLGGFSIICLVVHLLELSPEVQSGAVKPAEHLGYFLLRFFDFYGNFDFRKIGIRMNPPEYFDKASYPIKFSKDNKRLTIIDPNNPNNDISGGTANIEIILNCFKAAHATLQRRFAEYENDKRTYKGSILGCVLGGNYTDFIRQRDRIVATPISGAVPPPPPPHRLPPPPPPPPPQPYQPMQSPSRAAYSGTNSRSGQGPPKRARGRNRPNR